jgi:hypothetical protein
LALDLNAVMDAIGTRLVGVTGLVAYDEVAGRGADRAVIPVTVLVGKVSDRAARDQLAQFVSGTGAMSVKAAIEGGTGDLGGVAHTVRVMEARIEIVTIQAVEYLGASFDVEVFD